jgi:hypothetical protein
MAIADVVGWCATAIFVSSYFFASTATLRRMQMLGAIAWVLYGVLLGAPPVIAANVLVLIAAGWTTRRARTENNLAVTRSPPLKSRP